MKIKSLQTPFNQSKYIDIMILNVDCGEVPTMGSAGTYTNKEGVSTDYLGDICNLGSINYPMFVTKDKKFDFVEFRTSIAILVRALDNIIDISGYPLKLVENAAKLRRKIGCGLMGYGSMLYMMGLRYGSNIANFLTETISGIYCNEAYRASALLAKEKGQFELYDEEKIFEGGFIKYGTLDDCTLELIKENGLRNSQLLTVAPSGTTSLLAGGVSGGCEPVFEKEYYRWVTINHRKKEIETLEYPNWEKGEWFETKDFKFEARGDEQILISKDKQYMIDKNRGLTKRIACEDFGWKWVKENYLVDEIDMMETEGVFATATELSVKEHLDPFIIMGKNIDLSLSKTINLNADYPIEEFSGLYINAWREGVRGVTTYRQGTMTEVLETKKEIASTKKDTKKAQKNFYENWKHHENGEVIVDEIKLPENYPSLGYVIRAENRKFYFHVAFKDKEMTAPFAIFVTTNHPEKTVTTSNAIALFEELARVEGILEKNITGVKERLTLENNVNKITRMVSFLLRHNVDIFKIVKTIDSVEELYAGSFLFRIKKLLMSFVGTAENGETCPQCGDKIIFTEGCKKCPSCSFSAC